MPCDGRTLQSENFKGLYSLIFNVFGGDGLTTFALPDLRDKIAIGAGNDGTQEFRVGQQYGQDGQVLPAIAHTHTLSGSMTTTLSMYSGAATLPSPGAGNVIAKGTKSGTPQAMYTNGPGDMDLGQLTMIGPTITGLVPAGTATPQAVDTTPPSQVLNFIICVNGIYPLLQDPS